MPRHLPNVRIQVSGTIEITDDVADVLAHLTSYSLIEWFAEHCNAREIPVERMKSALYKIRDDANAIVRVRDQALAALREGLKPDDDNEEAKR